MQWSRILLMVYNYLNCFALGLNIPSSLCKIPAKKHVPTPVFDEKENLSYNNCGVWRKVDADESAPWSVSIVRSYGISADCPGILVSPTTIISEGCSYDYDKFKYHQVAYTAHLGECYRQPTSDNACISPNYGSKKQIISVTALSATASSSDHRPLHLWKTVKMENFRPSNYIRPVCLFNKDATRDFDTSQIYTSMYRTGSDRTAQIVQVKECLGKVIDSDECSRLNQVICVNFEDNEQKQNVLYNINNNRYFLRGIIYQNDFINPADYFLYFDILPLMREIVWQSALDLHIMPDVPLVKEKVAFYKGESFPGCGTTLRPSRRARSSDDEFEASPFIYNGIRSPPRSAPWHASLTRNSDNLNQTEYCGGSLISERAVLTAAHCFKGRPNPSQIFVTLGLYNRKNRQDSSIQTKRVARYLIHPNYKSPTAETKKYETYENDVAIILFRDNFQITNFVRPVCLWSSDYHLSTIVNKVGVLHGWGLNEDYTQPDILQKASLPVRSYWECYLANKGFFSLHLKPGVSFCAGQNGTSACLGDSGGGFVIEKQQKWFIRGIVSLGIVKKINIDGSEVEARVCNEMYPSLYTDLASYMQWIAQNVPDINRYVIMANY